MKKELFLTILNIALTCTSIFGQATTAPSNNWLGGLEYLGWDNASPTPLLIQHLTPNQPIRFLNFDNNVGAGAVSPKMELTTGSAMIDDLGTALPNDGLRIWNPGYPASIGFPNIDGALDLWTGDNNTTHIRFDGGGAMHTQNNRMEVIGKRNGLWLNAAPDFNFPNLNARIFFNIGTVAGGGDEFARLSNDGTGNNIGFMRIGVQPVPATPIDAARRLEVFDAANAPQFRLTQTAGTNFTDFQVNNLGDLSIFPWAGVNNRRVGINTGNPQNTLDINANGNYNPLVPNSGLRLRDMRAGSNTNGAPHGKVLSVDVNGDVILVDDQGAGSLSVCGGSLGASAVNYINKVSATNTICTSAIFEDNAQNVGIGTVTNLNAKLNINQTSPLGAATGLMVIADGTTNVTGCNSKQSSGSTVISYYSDINNATLGANNRAYYASINATTNTTNTGYQADVLTANGTTASTVTNYGFRTTINGTVQALYSFGFHAQSYKANYNYGIRAEAIPTPGINADALSCGGYFDGGTSNVGTSVINAYGVEAYAHGGSTANYGVAGKCNGSAADNYAVYGEVIQPGAASNNYAGYFAGNVYATGTITSSDQKLKTNITAISNALNIINQLHPKLFDYLSASYPSMHLPTGTHAGLIAQDLEMVLPNLVNTARQPAVTDSNGVTTQAAVDFKGVNYQELIPYLIAAVKEQQQQIDSLANLISNNAYPKQPLQSMSVTLSNQASIILNQNDPNPFAQNTTITYSIPEEVKNAQLLIYDNNGTILKTITINEKGPGSILIYGSQLSSGIYTYTLIADGKVIETKKMVKMK